MQPNVETQENEIHYPVPFCKRLERNMADKVVNQKSSTKKIPKF